MPDIAPGFGTQRMAPLSGRGDIDPDNSLFSGGIQISAVNRLPILIRAANGDLLEFNEWRPKEADFNCRGILMRRSTNNGLTFSQYTLIYNRTDYFYDGSASSKWMNLGVATPPTNTGRILIYFTHSDGSATARVTTVRKIYTDNHGAAWNASDQTGSTDITSTVKKTNNTTPAGISATTFDLANAAWGWYALGPGVAYVNPTSNQIVVPCNHRYSLDQSTDTGNGTNSFCHVFLSDDNGATEYLGGGFKETTAANRGTNECQIARLTTGDYYLSARVVSNTGTLAATDRAQAVITTAQLTSTWPTAAAMTDGTTNIPTSSCQGSLIVDAVGDVLVIFPGNTSVRGTLVVHKSTNNGSTFTTRRILNYGLAGYSATLETSTGNFLTIHEATDDWENAGATDNLASQQLLRAVRWSKDWLANESTYPGIARYYLNDGVAGVATYTGGNEIGCWDGYGPPAKGGAGASWHASGLSFSGSGAGIEMHSAMAGSYGGLWDAGLGDITYEFEVLLNAQDAVATLLDNRNAVTNARGVTITFGTDKLLTAIFCDGTTECAATMPFPVAEVAPPEYHTYTITYKRGTGVKIYVDGALYVTTADNLSASQGIVGAQVTRVGSRGGTGLGALRANTIIRYMSVQHKAITTGFWTRASLKPSLASLSGFAPAATTGLPSTSALKLALFAPGLGSVGCYGSGDRYGGNAYPYGPPIDGTVVGSYRDRSSINRLYTGSSQYKSSYWDTDTDFGRHVRIGNGGSSTATDYFAPSAATTDLDFFTQTGTGTLIFAANIIADSFSTVMTLLDNCNIANTAGAGFTIFSNSGSFDTFVRFTAGGSAWQLTEAMSGVIQYNKWYFYAIVLNGFGAKATFYRALYTAGVPATITGAASSGNVTGSNNATASAMPITVANKASSKDRGPNVRFGPILAFNTALDQTTIRAWGAILNQPPVLGASAGSHHIGTKLATGL